MRYFAALFLILLVPSCKSAEDPTIAATKEVLKTLGDPSQYNNAIRPSNNSGPVVVKVQILLRSVEVDDVDMTATVQMTFRMLWKDPRLAFTHADVNYVLIEDPYKAWLPDPFFKNSVKFLQFSTVHDENFLRVYPDGSLTYSSRVQVVLNAPMRLERFPHDSQDIPMYIASYGYTTDNIIFEHDGSSPIKSIESIAEHIQKFVLADHEVGTCHSVTTTGAYSCIRVILKLDRVFAPYLREWYIPCMFLVIVAWFSELIPPNALLPRLLLTLTPLITLAATSTTYTQSLAPVNYTKAMDIFSGISVIVIFATLIHVIAAYYRTLPKTAQDGTTGDIESPTSDGANAKGSNTEESVFRKYLRKAQDNIDFITRFLLVSFYVLFVLCYFAAYST